MKVDAVIFDLDDTLVAFDLVTESTWRQVCEEYAAENPSCSAAEVYEAVTKESEWYWNDEQRHKIGRNDIVAARRGIVRSAFMKHGFPAEDAVRVADRYSSQRLENMYLIPHARETLEGLLARNMRLALMSNGDSPIQRQKIKRFDLEKYFEFILIEGEVGFGKPDRRIYELALSKLGVPSERTVMIGDNLKWDVAGPISAGMHGIWFDVKGKGLPGDTTLEPEAVITSLPEIFGYLG